MNKKINMNTKHVSILIFTLLMISGCMSKDIGLLPRDEQFISTKKSKTALIIGSIKERYLSESYEAYVVIESLDDKKNENSMLLTTNVTMEAPDSMSKNHTKFYFVFEVPEGNYQIKKWIFRYRNGKSEKLQPPVVFNFKKGQIYYIGHFLTDPINMSLSLRDNSQKDIHAIKNKYFNFPKQKVINLSKKYLFNNWKLVIKTIH